MITLKAEKVLGGTEKRPFDNVRVTGVKVNGVDVQTISPELYTEVVTKMKADGCTRVQIKAFTAYYATLCWNEVLANKPEYAKPFPEQAE